MEIIAIVAMTEDRIIATEDGIPWDHPEDVRQYKDRISESPVIVGRTTYESMLPNPHGRYQIVLSRALTSVDASTVKVTNTVSEAISVASQMEVETVYVIGGGQIYEEFLSKYDKMIITVVEDVIEQDAFERKIQFPEFSDEEWEKNHTDDSTSGFRIDFWHRI